MTLTAVVPSDPCSGSSNTNIYLLNLMSSYRRVAKHNLDF